MIEITSREELQIWLESKPKDWSRLVATRAALRSLPLGLNAMRDNRIHLQRFALNIFRAVSMSWSDHSTPNHHSAIHSSVSLAVNSAIYAGYAASHAIAAANAISALDASVAAGSAANSANEADLSSSDMVVGPARAIALASDHFWKSVEKDCTLLENYVKEMDAQQFLSEEPLWQSRIDYVEARWRRASNTLSSLDPSWEVWIDWYQRRLLGEEAAFDIPGDTDRKEDKAILARLADATDEDFWGKGAHHVNTTLQGWIDEARARAAAEAESSLPEQEDGATAYGLNDAGRVDRLPASDQQHLRDAPDQRRNYADIRDAAQELAEEGQRLGGKLRRALDRFITSLPETFEQAEAYLVWRDGNALRRIHRAHRLVADSREPDDARLDPLVGEMLGGLIDLYNLFAFGDDGLRTLDERRVAAQERARADVERAAAKPLVDAALRAPDVATARALDDLKAEAEAETLPPGDPYADQAADQASRVRRNWFAALLSGGKRALNELKKSGKSVREGFDREVGKSAFTDIFGGTNIYGPVVQFIRENAQTLKHYAEIAYNNSGVAKLIDSILKHWPF